MVFSFRGRFEGKLDEKGRVFLPTSIRSSLKSSKQKLVVTNGYSKGFKYLDVYPFLVWKGLEDKISKMSSLKTEVLAFQRFYISGGQTLELDKAQRVLLPQDLRTYSGIKDTILFVGMGDKFEIWAKDQWNKLYESLMLGFDDTMKDIAKEVPK